MFARLHSAGVQGVEGFLIEVEVDLARGAPQFLVVGLPEGAVRESKERIQSALANSGYTLPLRKIRVNLAPADVPKRGSALDLPIALGILAAHGVLPPERVERLLILGELSLDGLLRGVPGVLSAAVLAKELGFEGVLVPHDNGPEAAIIEGLKVYAPESLAEAVEFLQGQRQLEPARADAALNFEPTYPVDFSEVKGQESAKRALEVAAAGGHNVLMVGPPGSGKTMLARRLPTILPPMTLDEALEVTKIHSVAGLLKPGQALVSERPFRAPHHTVSDVGLIGGGSVPKPGEVSLAHNGVLFLDELPEFRRQALEALRQPMEDGFVSIARARFRVVFPARFTLVAAMNPCPCGYYGDPRHACTCTPAEIRRYRQRISGPLLDRIDIHIEVPALPFEELRSKREGEHSEKIRERVVQARQRQLERFKGVPGVYSNSQMTPKLIKEHCQLDEASEALLKAAVDRFGLSARAVGRVLKVARTIADLEGSERIRAHHVSEAVQYRVADRKTWVVV